MRSADLTANERIFERQSARPKIETRKHRAVPLVRRQPTHHDATARRASEWQGGDGGGQGIARLVMLTEAAISCGVAHQDCPPSTTRATVTDLEMLARDEQLQAQLA